MIETTERPVWDEVKIGGTLMAIVDRRLQYILHGEKCYDQVRGLNWDMAQRASSETFTTPIIVTIEGNDEDTIVIQGFSPENYSLCTEAAPRPEHVELSASQYHGGGLQTKNEWIAILYGLIYAELVKMGFHVVPSYEDYF